MGFAKGGVPYVFRFHTGSIKRVRHDDPDTVTVKFRFHTGSIKSLYTGACLLSTLSVSIPYWFD